MTVAISNNNHKVENVLDQVSTIKPLPSTVTRALKLMDKPDASFDQLVSILALDQAIAVRILKQANSAYYGFRTPASTLQQAIVRLGLRRTKNILLTLSYSSLLGRRLSSYNLGHGDLWRHAVAVAMVAQRLAERLGYLEPDEAYVAGLLHDIGKLILDQHFQINWERLLETGQDHELSLIDAEEHLFQMNHAQVGSELARRWELPSALSEAIAFHHSPALATEDPKLTAIVHLADIIALNLGIGLTDDAFLPTPHETVLEQFNLEPQDVASLSEIYKKMLTLSMVVNDDIMPS